MQRIEGTADYTEMKDLAEVPTPRGQHQFSSNFSLTFVNYSCSLPYSFHHAITRTFVCPRYLLHS